MPELQRIPGAVVVDGVLHHAGSPLIEQRALASARAVAFLGDRRVLAVSGEDRLTWLDSVSSQSLRELPPGGATETLILDPQGRIEHVASVVDDGETTWLIVDADDAEPLLTWLMRMRFRLRVSPVDAGDRFVVIGGTAEAVAPWAAATSVPLVWRDPWPHVSPGGWAYAGADPHPGAARDWAEALVAPDRAAALVEAVIAGDVAAAGTVAADALRVAAWRPRWRDEVDGRLLPHEADWLRTAVHLDKGCYRGQETVAKVHNLGHPPRRLVALHLDGSDSVLPERGAAVRSDGDAIGEVTSVAFHHDDGPIALAVVKRSAPVPGDVTVDTPEGAIAAAAETIVPPDAGRTASVPRLPRLGRRTAAG
ncbi:CAF17-like 4Fe-4S cluster assembly/insertion protein YgfZ [Microbacterium xanthum]|uniref:CAF17-like 4Fe-4S cluster assembly/insertion protein YgfZ n=1 Tax=Microbacterium xanthum TaxID=3079794 RepID=UPI002AD4B43A|nr:MULTISPECIES: glycine cleavage T C-terminal barrel domain-containing protein [unclassified Microbacterium]MDZ8171923.1 glycine cleavage T C-terminal barrel domain-containing protein [Microbacterium sp. KSW-48]MDZ8199980.1 glycine cleavage T C-terminal barrel domain-containing protein [Microbacterium sp. SSW1-59]